MQQCRPHARGGRAKPKPKPQQRDAASQLKLTPPNANERRTDGRTDGQSAYGAMQPSIWASGVQRPRCGQKGTWQNVDIQKVAKIPNSMPRTLLGWGRMSRYVPRSICYESRQHVNYVIHSIWKIACFSRLSLWHLFRLKIGLKKELTFNSRLLCLSQSIPEILLGDFPSRRLVTRVENSLHLFGVHSLHHL